MSDLGDEYRAFKEHSKKEKISRTQTTLEWLNQNGVQYTHTKGQSILVAGRYELWPSTQAWFDRRGNNSRGRGMSGFLQLLQQSGILQKQ